LDIPPIPFRTALLGAGSVGTAVAELLRRAGDRPIAVSSRTEASARRAAEMLGAPVTSATGCARADVILVGAPDAALSEIDGILASQLGPGQVVWHFAGAYGIEPFPGVARAGAGVAALHPVQACPSVDAAIARLPGSAWGVTSSEELDAWAQVVISGHLDGIPVPVAESDRAAWHAAGVVTSNGMAALMATGERILTGIGIDGPEAVLGPLARGTIQNAVEAGGGADALTGPVVRGDTGTIKRHVAALRARDAELVQAYIRTSLSILETAVRIGRVDEATAVEMKDVLR
jgi:predicted short-subunit dehydrogenase-like oxidoreductase (DUF2520 family)